MKFKVGKTDINIWILFVNNPVTQSLVPLSPPPFLLYLAQLFNLWIREEIYTFYDNVNNLIYIIGKLTENKTKRYF